MKGVNRNKNKEKIVEINLHSATEIISIVKR